MKKCAVLVNSPRRNFHYYMYEFSWRSPLFDGHLGACHTLEIAFVFDNLNKEGNTMLAGSNAPQPLADAMHKAWVSFATHGEPGWPQYGPDQRSTMRFDQHQEVVNDPRSQKRRLWEGLH